jgi:hypothetical protein
MTATNMRQTCGKHAANDRMWCCTGLLCCLQQVLGGWAYHNGTRTGGVPLYENSEAVAKFIVAKYPGYNPGEAYIMPQHTLCQHRNRAASGAA